MNNLLLIIDVQKAFINEYTEHIIKDIEEHLKNNTYENIMLVKFINNNESIFFKKLNYCDCIDNESTQIMLNNINENLIIERDSYIAYTDELKDHLKNFNINKVYICGLDTDACVYKTVLDMFEDNIDIYVLEKLCSSSGGRKYHKIGIELLKRQIGKNRVI